MTKICSSFLVMYIFYKTKEFQMLELEKSFKLQVCITFVLFEKHDFHIFEHNIYFVSEKKNCWRFNFF